MISLPDQCLAIMQLLP